MSARPSWLSPSLRSLPEGALPAFELKFAVPLETATGIRAWAQQNLQLDPHADPENGYQITSIYYDTPAFEVFHRAPGYDVNKYRVRRYGAEPNVHLERKSKQNGRVWKCRDTMPLSALSIPASDWPVGWFAQELSEHKLQPVCAVTYQRSAYLGQTSEGGVRMTLDRSAFGRIETRLMLDPVSVGVPLLADRFILEFKFLTVLPALFKEAIERFRLEQTGLSKYRRCVRAAGLVPEGGTDA